MFSDNFKIKINSEEINIPLGIGLPVEVGGKIRRVLTTQDIVKYQKVVPAGEIMGSMGFINIFTDTVADLKNDCVVFDATYLRALGYKNITIQDIAPGDTSISYILEGEK